jgi:ketosteroid isomerase-like protein
MRLGFALCNPSEERNNRMAHAGEILKKFYAAVAKRDFATARTYLADDLLFVGLFQTYRGADEYVAALTGLLQITVRLDVKRIIAEGDAAAVFFELQTKAPAEATVLVAEWHQFTDGKISQAQSAFDARPYEAIFTGGKRS